MEDKIKQIGTAVFTDFDSWVQAYSTIQCDEKEDDLYYNVPKKYMENIYQTLDPTAKIREMCTPPADYVIMTNIAKKQFSVSSWSNYSESQLPQAKWPIQQQSMIKRFREFLLFSTEYGQPLNVGFWQEGAFAFLFMGNSTKGIIVLQPEKYLAFTPLRDFSHVSLYEMKAMKSGSDYIGTQLLPANANDQLSAADIKEDLNKTNEQLNHLREEEEAADNYKTKELSALKAQIEEMKKDLYKKQQSMLEELHQKQEAMEEIKDKLEFQIYLLDAEIYSIQCFLGEVVKFGQIRKGENAPDTEPIVLHQKLRFLDEDLGRLCSLYEIDWDHVNMFEDFLKHSPEAFDTFVPNERCVVLVRLSRTAKQFDRNNDFPFSNMLESYDYYHGKTVGILIRNGENLYLGWTDENRVHIDDDLLISLGQVEVTPVEEPPEFHFDSDRKKYIKKQKEMRQQLIDGVISRKFIYNILQGVVENKAGILPLPKGITLAHQSEYVQYAVADLWLSDTRFGSMNQIVKKCNEKIQVGDPVLTVQSLYPETDFSGWRRGYDVWQNVRGRGEANRTRDCSVDDCTIYPINLVEYDDPVPMTKYRYKSGDKWCYSKVLTRDTNALSEDCEILESYDARTRHLYVSVKKTESLSGEARSNFEIYEKEIINLTYLNSIWLEWVINNKTLGGWQVGGKSVNYAYAIRYLKTCMDFVRKREGEEKTTLDAVDPAITQIPEWQLKLSEWKLKYNVREITLYQAKRFARFLKQSSDN